MSTGSELDALRSIIITSLDVLQAELKAAQMPDLFLTKPELHPLDDLSYLPNSRLYEARKILLAASRMMGALAQSPTEKLLEEAWIHQRASALQCAVRYKIAERLADPSVDPEIGVSGAQLAKEKGLSADPFTRVMRMLSAHHYFRETSEGYFANNRISLGLMEPYAAPKGVLWESGFGLAVASHMVDGLDINEPRSAAQITFGFDTDMFTWLEQDRRYFEIFTEGMTGSYDASHAGLLADYPWSQLPTGTVVVDVGGGEGGLGMIIASHFPQVKIVSQDRPELQAAANKMWETNAPDLVKEGRIQFESHNFFTPQPRKGEEYIYIMRCILHDWPQEECVKILENLKAAMQPSSRLLIIEHVITPPVTTNEKIPLALDALDISAPYKEVKTPWPLPNGSQTIELSTDYEMFSNFKSAKERTPAEFDELTKAAGMRVVKIVPTRSEFSIVEISLE